MGKSLHQENQGDTRSLVDAYLLVQHGWVPWLLTFSEYGTRCGAMCFPAKVGIGQTHQLS